MINIYKMKNLKEFNVCELNTEEQDKTNGGFYWARLWGGFNFIRNSEMWDGGARPMIGQDGEPMMS